MGRVSNPHPILKMNIVPNVLNQNKIKEIKMKRNKKTHNVKLGTIPLTLRPVVVDSPSGSKISFAPPNKSSPSHVVVAVPGTPSQ